MKIRSSSALTRIAGAGIGHLPGNQPANRWRAWAVSGRNGAACRRVHGELVGRQRGVGVGKASSGAETCGGQPAALRAAPTVAVGSRPLVPAADRAAGAVAGTATETGAIVVRPRDEQALTSFISSVTDRGSVMYHKYLARGQFGSRFGPAAATTARSRSPCGPTACTSRACPRTGSWSRSAARPPAWSARSAPAWSVTGFRTAAMGQATTGAPRVPALVARSVAGVVGLDELARNQPQYVIPRGTAMSHGFPAAKTASVTHVAGAPTPAPSPSRTPRAPAG